jgi:hypothetical protein
MQWTEDAVTLELPLAQPCRRVGAHIVYRENTFFRMTQQHLVAIDFNAQYLAWRQLVDLGHPTKFSLAHLL